LSQLRKWQTAALTKFLTSGSSDFLAVATPGAGKTTFALHAAAQLLLDGTVQQVVVAVPTEHLKRQWADAAARFGINLDPTWTNTSKLGPHYRGVVVTYAQIAAAPARHRGGVKNRPTLAILDEVHHAGDSLSWGDAVRQAYEPATRRLMLSGSPWRSDTNPIPFVDYSPGPDGIRRSSADYTYGYGDALTDGVVRPVLFMAYSGQATWLDSAGNQLQASLDDPVDRETAGRALRTALDPDGDWIRRVLIAADERLTQIRQGGQSDAGGLVLATNQDHAKRYAKLLAGICGEPVTTVLSEDSYGSARIEEFSAGRQRWMVAVRMVSEGVDVPRLACGVYANTTQTSMFFTQAIGRFVRARRRGESATVFLPSVPALLGFAAALETERDHVLDRSASERGGGLDDDVLERANRTEVVRDASEQTFQALEATAHLDRVIYDGAEFGAPSHAGSDAESAVLTLPGIHSVDEVRELLAAQTRQALDTDGGAAVPLHRQLSAARRELSRLVSAYSARTGTPHAAVHMQLRHTFGGPAVGQASLEQLNQRITAVSSRI
jgi:superfamily II DNA or RNA helicase